MDMIDRLPRPKTLAEVAPLTHSLRAFSAQPIETEAEAAQTRAVISALTERVRRDWLAGRLAVLLLHYYTAPLSDRAIDALVDDWMRVIGDRPQWAIAEAADWWIGPENKERKRRPVPGDIAAQADEAMKAVRAAQTMLRLWEKRGALQAFSGGRR